MAKQTPPEPIETAKYNVTSEPASETAESPSTYTADAPPPQLDEAPIDPSVAKSHLERRLTNRPEKQDLIDKNILKDSSVAPALQAKEAELKRAQIGDKIDNMLQARAVPPLQPDESPIDTNTSAAKLEKSLKQRPDEKELKERNILKDSNVAPALQGIEEDLKRARLEDKLEHMLQHRPEPGELVKEGILTESEVPSSNA